MSYQIAIIAPYQELANMGTQVCKDLGINVVIVVGDLGEGVQAAKDLMAKGVDVIISRGGTATAITRQLNVPVVEISVSAFDLVRAIVDARKYGKKIGVVGFRNVIYGSKTLEQALEISIEELEIKSIAEVPSVIKMACESGIEVIVGDAVSVRLSKELEMPSVLVTSGKEAIGLALHQAMEMAEVRRRECARAEQFKIILDFACVGIIAADQKGTITLVNKAAEKMLGLPGGRLLGRLANEAIPSVILNKVWETGQARIGELHRTDNGLVVHNVVPVVANQEIVGVVATFQDASNLQAIETKVRQKLYLKGHVAYFTFDDIITRSSVMKKAINEAKDFAAADATILITGESGSGKEMLAQSVHNASLRVNGPFVVVNCAAVPESLLESELFGYEEGAFTGARKGGKKGFFELAHHGTIFLDEIGELTLDLQARLLRVLQQKAIMRVGGDSVIPVDVRIIAATHRNLEEAISVGTFREDLYYRLNVLRLKVPHLRQRAKEDIPLLVSFLTDKICRKAGRQQPVIKKEILGCFQNYHWPGNVRELENLLERLVVLRSGRDVRLEDIEDFLEKARESVRNKDEEMLQLSLNGTLADMEKEIIYHTLESTGGNKEETAQVLGMSKTTLWRRLKSYGFDL